MLEKEGDEWLSRQALRGWQHAIDMLESGYDLVHFPFVYLWDAENQQRVDALYGPASPEHKTLNFPRLFSVKNVSEGDFWVQRFKWEGTRGGFHCGSVPRENFLVKQDRRGPTAQNCHLPIIHWGYLTEEMRQRKYRFYTRIDPENDFEGRYLHCIGQPDRWCPGPVQLAPYEDR